MTSPSASAPAAGVLATTAVWLAVAAQAVVGGLTFGLAGRVDPFRDPVSDYVWQSGGRSLFSLAVLLLLAAAAVLAAAARLAGLPRSGAVTTLFLLWTAGLVVVLLFRSNISADAPTVSGQIHKAGGAVLFASLPPAALVLARALRADPRWRPAARVVRLGAVAGVVTAAAFGAAQFVSLLPQGLLERVALVAELVILVTIAAAVRRTAR